MKKIFLGFAMFLSFSAYAENNTDEVTAYRDGGTVYVEISSPVAQELFEKLPVAERDNGAAIIKTAGSISCALLKQERFYRCSMQSN